MRAILTTLIFLNLITPINVRAVTLAQFYKDQESPACSVRAYKQVMRYCRASECGVEPTRETGQRNEIVSRDGLFCPTDSQAACNFLLRPMEERLNCDPNCTEYGLYTKTNFKLFYRVMQYKVCSVPSCGIEDKTDEPISWYSCRSVKHPIDDEATVAAMNGQGALVRSVAILARVVAEKPGLDSKVISNIQRYLDFKSGGDDANKIDDVRRIIELKGAATEAVEVAVKLELDKLEKMNEIFNPLKKEKTYISPREKILIPKYLPKIGGDLGRGSRRGGE